MSSHISKGVGTGIQRAGSLMVAEFHTPTETFIASDMNLLMGRDRLQTKSGEISDWPSDMSLMCQCLRTLSQRTRSSPLSSYRAHQVDNLRASVFRQRYNLRIFKPRVNRYLLGPRAPTSLTIRSIGPSCARSCSPSSPILTGPKFDVKKQQSKELGSYEPNCLQSRSTSPATIPENTVNVMNQNILSGAGEAFFSSKPPPMPMRIMFIDLPSQYNPARVERLQQTTEEIEANCAATNDVFVTGLDSSMASYHPLRNSAPFYPHVLPIFKKSPSSRRLVNYLLRDLITCLPLANHSYQNTSSSKLGRAVVACDPRSPSVRSCCSIAVQARNKKSTGDITNCSADRESQVQAEDWIGGVRALRDSHVRLVLRQLRHIERLNHALDRVSKADSQKAI